MGFDGLHEVPGAAVVQEKDALTEAPERRGAEFAAVGDALAHIVRQIRSHVVQDEIGKGVYGDIALRGGGRKGAARLQRGSVAETAAN